MWEKRNLSDYALLKINVYISGLFFSIIKGHVV